MSSTILLIVYGIVLLVIATASLKYTDTIDNFLVAGRSQRKILVVASMLASTIGGGLTIGTVNRTYGIGFPAFWFVAAGALAHFLQGALLSRKVRDTEALTLPDLADKLVGPSLRTLTSIIVLITWIGITTAQFVAAAKIVSSISGLGHQGAVIAAASFMVVYTLIGGQKSVLRTDLFQFGFLSIALLAALAWLYIGSPPPAGTVRVEIFNTDFGFLDLLYYVIVLGGSYFICPMMFSRILSADSAENARKSSFYSGFGMLAFALVVTFIGLWARASIVDLGGIDPLNFIAQNTLPGVLGTLLIFGLLAAILSTGDTVLLTAAGVLEHDLLKRRSVAGIRMWTVAIGVVAAAIALFQTDIIGILIKTYNGYTAGIVPALFVAIVFSGKRKLKPSLTFAAVALGYALGTAGSFMPEGALAAKILPLAGLVASGTLALLAAYGPKKALER
ncbi:MAG: sodium:solute symporter family protein [Spirochaetia bacterium]|jgi:SSS family solute:Na+ symporter|nr:sodium:solute symporter family protein [Spirochaetia bacterium]